ncbi:ABC transporter substrate-binding protein [candidate division KSB1 bacterium]|nr:ABC transporter substrate-binding protein [candidate division KSB1 bacterium]NIV70254.1 substrate-binding domain-containing protein [Phycisphaerae bacterium]NIR71653.1 ABC transporter substrate-binding protein [candidate division KSB1 bacterium]NIT74578.1 ABC transporter substrate-binding protein [candidate division KSB1 bacterium]NIU24076.1 ABC transporter substrate-binding protein [candidate division KSB1 bacterium]
MISRFVPYILCSLTLGFLSCNQGKNAQEELTIAVIPKGTTHMFWQSIHAGAVKAAQELDVNILWVGPEKEDDRQQQITLVDTQILAQVDGIVLAPLDDMALRRPVRTAVTNNIPVVIIDSGLKDSEDIYTSFVATDNREGGRIAARELARLIGGHGKVILLRYQEGSASTDNREQGFLEQIQEFEGITVVSDEQYAGATKAQAQQASENLILRFKASNGMLAVDGVFCPNESSTYGMLQALRRNHLAGKLKFVGFDAAESMIEGLRQDEIHGLVVQNPFRMGYLGVKTMVQHLRGEPVEKRIDTGVTFVGKEDLSRPEIRNLIDPNLEKWLAR